MPARGQQARERRSQRERREPKGRHVAEQMIDRHERQAAPVGQGLGRREPDEQRADQARALRHGDCVDIGERRIRLVERRLDDGHDGSRCRREAISGTTPPKRAARLACDGSDGAAWISRQPGTRTPRRRQLQEVSIARITARGTGRRIRHMISASSRLSV